uniref:Uncharacterized protein AlNc14C452G11737 n=1 Tax=Albugo laibachii Nc14 TaxID=890382 RepID=F0WZZ4_9STRA|nr:hypothetical protein TRIADDRAFT_5525 [Albugo laibachii Nc14]|eukprot:CCA27075.1 hypothetical protein TRIADDRAFT_5525 [Albugo laibachii Nc14]
MDETGLFYCVAPDKTIARRPVEVSKKIQTRVTVALTCNADGLDKCEPFIIGYANKYRCFQKKSGDQLGFYYRSNLKAWMNSVLFQSGYVILTITCASNGAKSYSSSTMHQRTQSTAWSCYDIEAAANGPRDHCIIQASILASTAPECT